VNVEILVQPRGATPPTSLRDRLTGFLVDGRCEICNVAVAYATVAGVRALLGAYGGGGPSRSRWLLGLDDYLTQPAAIDLVRQLPQSEVRVAASAAGTSRFHPKVYYLTSANRSGREALVVGSNNLTKAAFCGNSEASAFLTSDQTRSSNFFSTAWDDIWRQGVVPSASLLRSYQDAYSAASQARKALAEKVPPKAREEILDRDEAELDPALATTCWIECGKVTGMGRELEFKSEQALFFGLHPSGGPNRSFVFETSDRKRVELTIRYREQNSMWRIQFTNDVPEVRAGLRPHVGGGLGRSPFVAVFARTKAGGRFRLSFLDETSAEYEALIKRSSEFGTVGKTLSRRYGWC
jgi:hypothetical protein